MEWQFNTLAKVLVGALVVLGIAWAVNAFAYWEVKLKRNNGVALSANARNMEKIDSVYHLAFELKREMDSVAFDSVRSLIIETSRTRHRLLTRAMKEAMVDSVNAINIIDSVWTANYNRTWMSVILRSEVKCQAVANYGTHPDSLNKSGVKEESFTYNNHSLRIGNKEPLIPGTKYYVQVVATDSLGNDYKSEIVTGETIN